MILNDEIKNDVDNVAIAYQLSTIRILCLLPQIKLATVFFLCEFLINEDTSILQHLSLVYFKFAAGSNCGIVPLAISRNGHFITHSVPFEYRPKPTSRMDSDWFKVSANNSDWLALNDHEFRFRLLSRLNEMQTHLMSFIGNGAPNGSQNSDVANNLFGSSQDSPSNSEVRYQITIGLSTIVVRSPQ